MNFLIGGLLGYGLGSAIGAFLVYGIVILIAILVLIPIGIFLFFKGVFVIIRAVYRAIKNHRNKSRHQPLNPYPGTNYQSPF